MHKLFKLAIFSSLLFIASCHNGHHSGRHHLTGVIHNAPQDFITLTNQYGEADTITLNADGTFEALQIFKPSLYHLRDGKNNTTLLIEHDKSTNVEYDANDHSNTLKFNGDATVFNSMHIVLSKMRAAERDSVRRSILQEMTDSAYFNRITQSIQQQKSAIASVTDDKHYHKLLTTDIAGYHFRLLYYGVDTVQFFHTEIKKAIPNSHEHPFEYIDLKDFSQIAHPAFTTLNRYAYLQDIEVTENNIVEVMNHVSEASTHRFIKESILEQLAREEIAYGKNKQAAYDILERESFANKVPPVITKKLEAWTKLDVGKPAPSFAFPSITGDTISSEQLKGKITYIDVWATWCPPCKYEIPFLDTLQHELKDEPINFVSICYRDKEEKWHKFVTAKELPGIHLFAENPSFFEYFNISGIPRFIILDEAGNIVSPDAARPSNKQLKAELLELTAALKTS